MAKGNSKIVDECLEPFYIRITDTSYDVVEQAVSEASDKGSGGREYEITRAYCSNIGNALKKVSELKTVNSIDDQITLKEYLETYKTQIQQLTNAIKIHI